MNNDSQMNMTGKGDRAFTNTERFINEVSTRSCIWNKHCPEYKVKSKRKKAWEEICEVFFDNYNTKSTDRKEHLCLLLQKKWKSLRDNYVRELRKNTPMKYGHSMSLSFLKDTIAGVAEKANHDLNSEYNFDLQIEKQQDVKYNYEENDDQETVEDELMMLQDKKSCSYSVDDNYLSSNSNHSTYLDIQSIDGIKSSPTFSEQHEQRLSNALAANKDNVRGRGVVGVDDEDEDRMFLLSLLKDLRKVPQQNKLEAKSELLLVLNKWQKTFTNGGY
ncbi:uncharacterized protein LOC129942365 [Eupeodes corollae]|uniref:uncharacterized protein LOC129942365 n=1 Tax=Eupeodes corollae TaxID=290404 RepID=UPI002490AE6E|nr:uncharacterized protein LOC129942365 [Eupeodes corollae]